MPEPIINSTCGEAIAPRSAIERSPHLRPRSWVALALALLCAVIGMLAFSRVALADSAMLTVTNTAGESDPAADLARVFTLSGNASVPEYAFVKYRATGGAACAPDASEDTGEQLEGFYGTEIEGNFSIKKAITWGTPGPVQFCIWIAASSECCGSGSASNTIVTPITQVITFRSPGGTIGGTLSPSSPKRNQHTILTVTGSSEAPEEVFAKVRTAGGAPCAPTYESDPGSEIIQGDEVNGSFSVSASLDESTAGSYLICMWLAGSESETPAIAGPQPLEFNVGHPAAPTVCMPPAVPAGDSLVNVKSALRVAHCKVGRLSSAASRTVRRGTVLHLDAVAGTALPTGTAVGITLSAGPPCVVPALPANASLGRIEHRIIAAHCSIGRIRFATSAHRRRGTVLRLTPGPGKRRVPQAKIGIVVSKGPPRRLRGRGTRYRNLPRV